MNAPAFQEIELKNISPSKTNRKRFDDVKLQELADSIKLHGVAVPILVRPLTAKSSYELVAGERRWRASKMAGVETIPAIVRELSDEKALEIQVIENLQREDVHPLEEAEGYERLMASCGVTADELAAKVGKSKGYVYGRLKLLSLVPEARQAFYDGHLTASTSLLVARLGSGLQMDACEAILGEPFGDEIMSYREAKDWLHRKFHLQLSHAPWSLKDAKLVPAAGACNTCPKRSGAQPLLFDDIGTEDVCTDKKCFETKKTAYAVQLLAKVKKSGLPIYADYDAYEEAGGDLILGDASLYNIDPVKEDVEDQDRSIEEAIPQKLMPAPVGYVLDDDQPDTAAPIAVYRYADIDAALVKAGLAVPPKEREEVSAGISAKHDAEHAKRQAEHKAAEKLAKDMSEGRLAVYLALRKARPHGPNQAMLEMMVRFVGRYARHSFTPLLKFHGVAKFDDLEAKISDMTMTGLEHLAVDFAVASMLRVNEWEVRQLKGKMPDSKEWAYVEKQAALLNVDVAALMPADPNKKPAAKKAAAKKSQPETAKVQQKSAVSGEALATGDTVMIVLNDPRDAFAKLHEGEVHKIADFEQAGPKRVIKGTWIRFDLEDVPGGDQFFVSAKNVLKMKPEAKPAQLDESETDAILGTSKSSLNPAAAWPFPTGGRP